MVEPDSIAMRSGGGYELYYFLKQNCMDKVVAEVDGTAKFGTAIYSVGVHFLPITDDRSQENLDHLAQFIDSVRLDVSYAKALDV